MKTRANYRLWAVGSFALIVSCLSLGCATTEFTTIVNSTNKVDAQVAKLKEQFGKATDPATRMKLRRTIIADREKQFIWANRINVWSIPQLRSGEITHQAGSELKGRWVASATAKLTSAKALPIDGPFEPTPAHAEPVPNPVEPAPTPSPDEPGAEPKV